MASNYDTEILNFDTSLVDADALTVVDRLRHSGFVAYLVGGCVRDILRGKRPKDFDISTDATPEEIKRLFGRRCLIIGKRFRLAHVRYGKKVFEVSTFRSSQENDALVTRDNEWGTAEEDALRRDFTINGLFYDPFESEIIDYVDGFEDVEKGYLRCIGDPIARFRQDPVRMLRLLKFCARFNYNVDPANLEALKVCREEIIKSSPARVLEELLKMLESGAAFPFFKLLQDHNLLSLLLPDIDAALKQPVGKDIYRYLEVADKIHEKNAPFTLDRALLIACLLYPVLDTKLKSELTTPTIGQITQLTTTVIRSLVSSAFSHFPKRITATTAYLLITQYKMTPVTKRKFSSHKVVQDRNCYWALKFLRIRTLIDSTLETTYYEWQKLYREHHGHGDRTSHPHGPRKRKRRGPRRPRG